MGRIDLVKNFSFFEVEEKQAQNVVKALNRTNWNGRKVTVEVAGEEASTEHKGRGKRNEGNDQVAEEEAALHLPTAKREAKAAKTANKPTAGKAKSQP